MKATKLKKAALLAGSLSFLAGSAFSQPKISGAGGYTTYNLNVGFNLIGISLFEPVIVSGTIDSEAGATITDADPGDLQAILNDPDATYLIEILSGAQSGAVAEIASVVDADKITLSGAIGAGNADYQIRQAPTLDDLFGNSLVGGAAVLPTTDIVWLPDATDPSGFKQYALNTTGGEFRSTSAFFVSPAKSIAVFYPDGLYVEVGDTAKDVVVAGMVKTTGTIVAANEGFNLVANNAPVGNTLDSSGLDALLVSSTANTTDRLWLPDGTGGYDIYFVHFQGDYHAVTSPFLGSEGHNALTSGFFIERRVGAGDTAGPLQVPADYAALQPTAGAETLNFDVVFDAGHDRFVFTWSSQAGTLYRLRSDIDATKEPSLWDPFDGNEDIAATPPVNSLTIPRPSDPTPRLFVIEEYPAPGIAVFVDDFESGPGGWASGLDGAPGTLWELGTPTHGPASANSGANCFGTNLGADYGLDADSWLRSPPIDLTAAAAATLKFALAKDIEDVFDFLVVNVLDAADDSQLALVDTIDGTDLNWTDISKPLPAVALGKSIKIEFRFISDDFGSFAGAFVDDVSVTTTPAVSPSPAARSMKRPLVKGGAFWLPKKK